MEKNSKASLISRISIPVLLAGLLVLAVVLGYLGYMEGRDLALADHVR